MFEKVEINGVFIFNPKLMEDERGYTTKIFSKEVFVQNGLNCEFEETFISHNKFKNVFRGFHFQLPPYAQSKLLYCMNGEFECFFVDLRRSSNTFGKVSSYTIKEKSAIYIPLGVANAFVILKDNTDIIYHLTSRYMLEFEGGLHYNSFDIKLNTDELIVSKRDEAFPLFKDFESPFL